ncbi:MAG: hypothetical protein D8M56_18965 [Chloroflexi bacterium]|nr:hypothetical protein [Chloroflexota bacterium]
MTIGPFTFDTDKGTIEPTIRPPAETDSRQMMGAGGTITDRAIITFFKTGISNGPLLFRTGLAYMTIGNGHRLSFSFTAPRIIAFFGRLNTINPMLYPMTTY